MTVATRLEVAHSSPDLTGAETTAVQGAMHSGFIAQGSAAANFASALAADQRASFAALTSSGTAGIVLALNALGVGDGDEVVLPSYVCGSVWDAVCLSGATPVLCDTGDRWRVTADSMRAVMSTKTRAIIAVDTFGLAADIEALASLGVPVIDDRCQAFGLPSDHGRFAAYSVCSFHATKCLTAGEGGAVLAWDAAHERLLRKSAQNHRRTLCTFSDLQAVVAEQQLARWPSMLTRRRHIASRYLGALDSSRTAALPGANSKSTVWFRFPVLLRPDESFDEMRERFALHGVQVRRGVDALLHRSAGLSDARFPATARAFEQTLSLPLWPAMTDAMVDHVLETAKNVLGS